MACNVYPFLNMNNETYPYLMESPDESLRLDIKTDSEAVKVHATWCNLKPGMRVLDIGCGSGRTSSILNDMVQPGGSVLGVDGSLERIQYAKKKFSGRKGLGFVVSDFSQLPDDLGRFDLIWIRFVLEYYRQGALDIVKNMAAFLKPGGSLCLLDIDHYGMGYYPLPDTIQTFLPKLLERLAIDHNFDPHSGIKLYSYLHDLKYQDIQVQLFSHHLIYGDLKPEDHYNWLAKIKIMSQKCSDLFEGYPGGQSRFFSDFLTFLNDPRRFIYSPLIIAKGVKSSTG